MRSDLIIDLPPFFDKHLGFCERVKLVSVKTAAAKGTVKTFARSVVPGLTGIAVNKLYADCDKPGTQFVGNEFAATVASVRPRSMSSAASKNLVMLPRGSRVTTVPSAQRALAR